MAAAAPALLDSRAELWRRRLPYSPHVPTAPQARFLLLPQREGLYGGAAGGGKSDALLMAALQYVHVPRYAAIIFRKTYQDLAKPGAIMDRAKEWLIGRPGVHWHETDHRFTFQCQGGGRSTLTFGYLQHEGDKYAHQGAEYQFIGWDELTQFTETMYTYLISRCRRPKDFTDGEPLARVPLRIRGASNPGGKGHAWVLARFIEEAVEEHVGQVWKTGAEVDLMLGRKWVRRRPVVDDDGRTVHEDRAFVPAKLEDNPYLDVEEYSKGLRELDAVTRAQLRRGDWSVRPKGPLFDRTWFEIVDHVPAGVRRLRYWDMAATEEEPGKEPDWTVGTREAYDDASGTLYVEHVDRFRERPAGVEERIKSNAQMDGKSTPIVIEQEPGSSGVTVIDHYVRRVLPGWTTHGDKKTGSKVDLAGPLSALAERRGVKLVRGPWNAAWLDEIEAFPFGEKDDQVDSATGAHRHLTSRGSTDHTETAAAEAPRGRLAGSSRSSSTSDDDDGDDAGGGRRW